MVYVCYHGKSNYFNFLFFFFYSIKLNLDIISFCINNRAKNFEKSEDYNKTWNKNEDGKVNANGPRRIIDQTQGPGTGFVNRYNENTCIISTSSCL